MKNILFYCLVLINIIVIYNIYTIKEDNVKLIQVEVKGYVSNPGVYELEEDSSVSDLIDVAGGLLDNADISVTNLARKLNDEMVVVIYSNEEINEMKKGSTSIKYIDKECVCPKIVNDSCLNEVIYNSDGEVVNTGKVSLNSATIDELMTLPGIGLSKAQNIINYREENKGFKTVEDIMNVKGIGASIFEKIKDYLTL